VDEGAKREAEKRWPPEHYYGNLDECDAAQEAGAWGITHLAALLLSDEPVEAAAKAHAFSPGGVYSNEAMRAALTAALTKITEDKE